MHRGLCPTKSNRQPWTEDTLFCSMKSTRVSQAPQDTSASRPLVLAASCSMAAAAYSVCRRGVHGPFLPQGLLLLQKLLYHSYSKPHPFSSSSNLSNWHTSSWAARLHQETTHAASTSGVAAASLATTRRRTEEANEEQAAGAIDAGANSWVHNLECSPEQANIRRHSCLEMGAWSEVRMARGLRLTPKSTARTCLNARR